MRGSIRTSWSRCNSPAMRRGQNHRQDFDISSSSDSSLPALPRYGRRVAVFRILENCGSRIEVWKANLSNRAGCSLTAGWPPSSSAMLPLTSGRFSMARTQLTCPGFSPRSKDR
jgi:hypothetical protein